MASFDKTMNDKGPSLDKKREPTCGPWLDKTTTPEKASLVSDEAGNSP
ncbi:MAG TPA: hypothetical protein VMG10_12145 [Gemmataceae bacterium]|nr:hypothetical protein [Gemmataceae bacterium]